MASYRLEPDIQAVAERLIPKHHAHLSKAKIAYVMKEHPLDKPKSPPAPGRKSVMASAAKVPPQYRVMSGYDLKIVVDEYWWDRLDLSEREALVDHELCHFGWSPENVEYFMVDHDIEEFAAILRRHGEWKSDVADFCREARQLDLFEGGQGPEQAHVH